MERTTVKAKLIQSKTDGCDYTTYVFEIVDEEDKTRLGCKYVMCVRYPNWEHETICYYEPGFLEILEVLAGIDKYYKNGDMIPYNYSNIQFLKFIPDRPVKIDKTITLD